MHGKEIDSFSLENNIECFEVSAKTGDNIIKTLLLSCTYLPFFEGFTESKDDIYNELVVENNEKDNSSISNNSFSGGVCLETSKKEDLDDNDENENKNKNKDIVFNIKDSNRLDEMRIKKNRKCINCS